MCPRRSRDGAFWKGNLIPQLSSMCFLEPNCFIFSFYTCNGASDNIFDHCRSRSSAPTTPVIPSQLRSGFSGRVILLVNLVPIGSPVLLMSTQALSSNRIRLPSFLCTSFFALTTTACLMSPLRTLLVIPNPDEPGPDSAPNDLCFCTTTMMRSPA
jgi:hypothetical protein